MLQITSLQLSALKVFDVLLSCGRYAEMLLVPRSNVAHLERKPSMDVMLHHEEIKEVGRNVTMRIIKMADNVYYNQIKI